MSQGASRSRALVGRNLTLPPERGSVSRSHVGMFETLQSNPNAFQASKPLRVTDPRSDYRAFALVVVPRCARIGDIVTSPGTRR